MYFYGIFQSYGQSSHLKIVTENSKNNQITKLILLSPWKSMQNERVGLMKTAALALLGETV